MKGAIFKLLEDFVDATYGPDAFDDLVEATELETVEPFVGPGNYPPGDLLALVATAVSVHETSAEQLLRAFGRHAFPSLARSVPTLIEGLDGPRAFLCGLESMIHTEVRKLDPEASPARFTVIDVDETEILLRYESPFGLFPLVEGFLDGVADWYQTPVDHELVDTEKTNGTFRSASPTTAREGRPALSTPPALEAATANDDRVRRLERKLARARRENEILETMIEEKTRSLYLAQAEMQQGKVFLENVLQSMQAAVLITDHTGSITLAGGTTSAWTGRDHADLLGQPISALLPADRSDSVDEEELRGEGGVAVPVLVTRSKLTDDQGAVTGTVCVATDISERKRLEVELRHAQKLESIGQLAAGVAHELNTPIQFVGDSVRFLGDVLQDVMALLESHGTLRQLALEVEGGAEAVQGVDDLADEIDLEFVQDEAPKALARTLDGLDRVATIVKALKQFSHPGTDDLAPADLNEIVLNTLTVAKNEYKYVAEVRLDAGELPDVVCNRGDLGQVLINLVVNAAQAIADQVEGTGRMGTISIRTRSDERWVTVDITDTGGGIPPDVQARVFEPFFTTKEVGKGSGQGLALAHNLIVNKHQGRLWFDVEDGTGTTFHLSLPRQQRRR